MPAKRVLLHPEALKELKEAVAFYRSRGGESLALRFKALIKEAFHKIASNPTRYPIDPEFRKSKNI